MPTEKKGAVAERRAPGDWRGELGVSHAHHAAACAQGGWNEANAVTQREYQAALETWRKGPA